MTVIHDFVDKCDISYQGPAMLRDAIRIQIGRSNSIRK